MNLKKPNNTFNVDYAMQISNILLVVGQNMEKVTEEFSRKIRSFFSVLIWFASIVRTMASPLSGKYLQICYFKK